MCVSCLLHCVLYASVCPVSPSLSGVRSECVLTYRPGFLNFFLLLTHLDMPSVVVRPSPSQVSPTKPATMDDHHSERSATTATEDTTPRRTQPAPPAVRRPNTPRASPPPSDNGSKAGKKKPSSQAPSPIATRDDERAGGEAKKEPRSDNDKWVESVDYAYEYVPVAQRREGRKNM